MSVLYFLLLVGVLVLIHELGHFVAAKLLDVKVLRVDTKDRKVGLSMKNVDDPTVPEDAIIPDMPDDAEELPSSKAAKKDLRGGTGAAGPLFALPGEEEEEEG